MSNYHGLVVKASATPNMSLVLTEGLLFTPDTNQMLYVPAATPGPVSAASSGMEYIAILEICENGAISSPTATTGQVQIKYGTAVAAGSGLAVVPTVDQGSVLLAVLGSAAFPINSSTTALINNAGANPSAGQAVISGLILSAEFGGR